MLRVVNTGGGIVGCKYPLKTKVEKVGLRSNVVAKIMLSEWRRCAREINSDKDKIRGK